MGSNLAGQTYRSKVRWLFTVVMIALPIQFYFVYNFDNVYPCVHLPGFKPVLDSGTEIYYTDRTMYVVTDNNERIEVVYTEVFDEIPEFFARHTMLRLFYYTEPGEKLQVDDETANWLKSKLKTITNRNDLAYLEIETKGFSISKNTPSKLNEFTQSVNRLRLQ